MLKKFLNIYSIYLCQQLMKNKLIRFFDRWNVGWKVVKLKNKQSRVDQFLIFER